jgi:PAS domain S-box-containing protein
MQNNTILTTPKPITDSEMRLNDLYTDYVKTYSTYDLLKNGLTSIDTNQYSEITKYAKWLKDIIIMTENIPICVSIASRKPQNSINYPLVYVNKAFEETTQYSREEIVGKNCNFLQKNVHNPLSELMSNNEINTKMHMAQVLAKGDDCKVLITNYKKDGSIFRNLLHLFPIKYKSGEICYYMGIQCDVTNPETPYNYIMLVDDLMTIMPRIIDDDQDISVNSYIENMIESIGIYKEIEEYKPTRPLTTTKRSINHRRHSILVASKTTP